MQLLLQFLLDSFETFQIFCSWSEDVHVVWTILSNNFLTFLTCEHSHLSASQML